MTEYYMGVLIGAGIGYCLALITLVMMWALCVMQKERTKIKLSKRQRIVEKFVVSLAIIVSLIVISIMMWLVVTVEFLM